VSIVKLIILSSLIFCIADAQTLQEYKDAQLKAFNKNGYDEYKKVQKNEFRAYKKAQNEIFKQYKKEISAFWSVPKMSTKTKWIAFAIVCKVIVSFLKSTLVLVFLSFE